MEKKWKAMKIHDDVRVGFLVVKEFVSGITRCGNQLFINFPYSDPIEVPTKTANKVKRRDEVLAVYAAGKIVAIIGANGEIILDDPIVESKTGISLGIREVS